MNPEQILQKIQNDQYQIKYDHDCNCNISWVIQDGELREEIDPDACWDGNILIVDGEPIAEYLRYDGANILVDNIKRDDIPTDVWDKMRLSDVTQQGQSKNNQTHDAKSRDALIDFLIDCGYELDKDKDRGFANEYTMILRESNDENHINDRAAAEQWADSYLYAGDATTEAFVGLRFDPALAF